MSPFLSLVVGSAVLCSLLLVIVYVILIFSAGLESKKKPVPGYLWEPLPKLSSQTGRQKKHKPGCRHYKGLT